MANARSAEMVFTSNRVEPVEPVTGPARLPAQPPLNQGFFEKIMDRLEQLEFALAEAVLRTDEQEAGVTFEALSSRLDAIADQVSDPGAVQGDLGRIADRLDAAAAARADDIATISARLTALEDNRIAPIEAALQTLAANQQAAMTEIVERLDGPDTQLRHQVDRLADGLATLEAKLAARLTKIGESVETFASRPAKPPDITPLREMTARHMVAQKTIADRHASQIAKLMERFSGVEAELKALPDQTALEGVATALKSSVDGARAPIAAHLDDLTKMLAALTADVKQWQDTNLSQWTEPLMARMDRLDTTAEQRQRELNQEITEIATRPQPVNDLTPVRESFARLMVALQAMHQSREASEAETANKINAMMDSLQALPDRLEAASEHRQRDLLREIEALSERPLPAPDLTPVRETMSRFMVAVQSLEDARANSEAELAARFGLLTERIESLPNGGTDAEVFANLLEPIAEAIQTVASRPAPVLDTSTIRSAFSQQMVAISTWMQRQDVLQLAMSDLLETLVERNAGSKDVDMVETIKTMIAAGQYSARKQVDEAEERLSGQLKELGRCMSGAVQDAPEDAALGNDHRLMEALQDLRGMVSDGDDPDRIAMQARELRTALAETLAAMQSGQTARI